MQTVQYNNQTNQSGSRDKQIAKSVAVNNLFGHLTKQEVLALTNIELGKMFAICDEIASYIGR